MKTKLTWLLGVALILGACATDSGSPTTAADGEGTTSGGGGDGISTVDNDLGTVLVNPEGFTVYVFTNDTDGESTCYDSCADLWPAVPADTPIGGGLDASIFGSTTRTDGAEQLTVNGQPLYTYAPDTNPGDTNGQGVGGVWFVVGADGALIGGPEATGGRTDY